MSISFDELIQKAKDVALTAGKVAGDVVGEVVDGSKARLAEVRLSGEIREVTERLGSIVYEAAKTGRDSIKLQEMLITELDNLYKSLEEQRKKSAAEGVEAICPKCGEKSNAHSLFCCKCGARMAVETEAAEYAVETDIPEESVEAAAAEAEATAAEVESIAAEVEAMAAEVESAAAEITKD